MTQQSLCRYPEFKYSDDSCESSALLKAWLGTGSEPTVWSFKRIVRCIFNVGKPRMKRVWARDIGGGLASLEDMYPHCSHVFEKQGMLDSDCEDEHEESKDERTVSSVGFVFLVLWMRVNRRAHAERRRCQGLLCAILCSVYAREVGSVLIDSFEANLKSAACGNCLAGPLNDGICRHAQEILVRVCELRRRADDGDGLDPRARFGRFLCDTAESAARVDCPRFASVVRVTVDMIAHALDAAVASEAWPSDPLEDPEYKREAVVSRGRGMRYDEDYKKAMSSAVLEGRAYSGANLMRARIGGSGQTALKEESRFLRHYNASALLTCASVDSVGTCSMAIDAKRLGNPAEETELALFWTHGRQRSVVLPPQVPTMTRTDDIPSC